MKKSELVQPTPEQVAWLKEYHKVYIREYISKKLGVSEATIARWVKEMGLVKRAYKSIKYTDEQKKFIKDNYQKMPHAQIALHLKLSLSAIQGYCFRNKLTKRNWGSNMKEPKRIILGPPKTEITRPPATYSNMSREQHIEK